LIDGHLLARPSALLFFQEIDVVKRALQGLPEAAYDINKTSF